MLRDNQRLTLGKMQNPVRGLLHGAAAASSIAGAIFLWSRGAGDLRRQLPLLIFAVSLLALYTTSSLYHSVPWRRRWKARMQRVDHSMIYVLVAGTFTPLAAIVLDGWLRTAALAATWGIATIGIFQKVFVPQVPHGYSIALQTMQGWLGVLFLAPLAHRLPWMALQLTVVGGLLYTVGMVCLVTERPRLWPRVFSYHEVFHVFVVAGSAAHYAMTLWYVAPFTGS